LEEAQLINISSMFAKSPFKPLRDHMDKVAESVAPLKLLLPWSLSINRIARMN